MNKLIALPAAAVLVVGAPVGLEMASASPATSAAKGPCKTISCLNSRLSALEKKVNSMHTFEHYLYECLGWYDESEYSDPSSASGGALDFAQEDSNDNPVPPYFASVADGCQSDTNGPSAGPHHGPTALPHAHYTRLSRR